MEGNLALAAGGSASLKNGGVVVNTEVWIGGGSKPFAYNGNASSLTFAAKAQGGFNHQVAKSLCLTWSTEKVSPCAKTSPARAFPMCDSSKTLAERVDDLVARLEDDEQFSQLSNEAKAIDRLWIQQHNWLVSIPSQTRAHY
jgi:hypothetical protein